MIAPSAQQAAGIPYGGPRCVDGLIPIGVDQHGAWRSVQVADAGRQRVCHGLVTGDAGSGITTVLEHIAMSALANGRWSVHFCDGRADTAGASEVLSEHMTSAAAGVDGAHAQLDALEHLSSVREAEGHSAYPDRSRQSVYPERGRMGALWVIDNFGELLLDAMLLCRIEYLLRVGPRVGIAVWAATSSLELREFGSHNGVRTSIADRNLIALRSSARFRGPLGGGREFDASALPGGGGYGYVASTADDDGPQMVRTGWHREMARWATGIAERELDDASRVSFKRLLG